jgi:putative tricarboxylic transport membrane protein
MRLHDSLLATLFFALAVAVVATAQGFPPSPGQPVGPGLFPTAVGVCLALASVALFVRSFAAAGPRTWLAFAPELRRPRILLGFVLAPAAVLFYLMVSEQVGFLPCSVLILAVLFTTYGVRLRLGLPLAVVMSLVIYGFFGRILAVPLPQGILEGIL